MKKKKNKNKNITIKKSQTNRKHKDSVFRMLFGNNKENLLSLYNALNRTNYTDTRALKINTLKNVIYMNITNDISFVLFHTLWLYEHQSTINPNIPLRCLYYVSDLLQELYMDASIYGRDPIKIAEPRFVVFYNGEEKIPERSEYKLSELFEIPTKNPEIELKTTVLNINPGYNESIKETCRKLGEYTVFVEEVRNRMKSGMGQDEAIKDAAEYCIEHDVLRDFLRREEAKMRGRGVLYEFDEEKYKRQEHEAGYKKGLLEGRQEGRLEGRQEGRLEGRQEGRLEGRKDIIIYALNNGKTPKEIAEFHGISVTEVLEVQESAKAKVLV